MRKKMKKTVKGYKVFNPDWTCKGFQYKIGGEYLMDEDIKVCSRGFHFCENLNDCFDYYDFDPNNKVAEIEAIGIIIKGSDDSKSVTNHIKILKELTWFEVCDLVNSGKNNTGRTNSGDWNSGNCNSGNWNSGLFNSKNSSIKLFNFDTKLSFNDLRKNHEIALNAIIYGEFPLTKWISADFMTNEEKKQHPEYATIGGYLKTNSYKESWALAWKMYNKKEKEAIKNLPNFDKDVFFEITGIEV